MGVKRRQRAVEETIGRNAARNAKYLHRGGRRRIVLALAVKEAMSI